MGVSETGEVRLCSFNSSNVKFLHVSDFGRE